MGLYSAPSDLDYEDEASGRRRGVRFTCPSCARDFWIATSEPYPGGRPLCDNCAHARDEFARTTPQADGPTRCCAMHAVVIEGSAERAIWQCPICLWRWSVPNPPVEPVEGV